MYTRESEYDTRHGLTEAVIRSAVRIVTDPVDPLRQRIKFVVLNGKANREQAMIQVYSPTGAAGTKQTPAPGCQYHTPLIVPHHNVNTRLQSALVTHPRAVFEARAGLAQFLMTTERQNEVWRDQVFAWMQQIGNRQAELTKQVITGSGFGVEPTNPPHRDTPVPTFIADFDTAPTYEEARYPNPTFQ